MPSPSHRSLISTGAVLLGVWRWEPGRHLFYADEELSAFFDVPAERARVGVPSSEFVRRIHLEDRSLVLPELRASAGNGRPFSATYRVVTRRRGIRRVCTYGYPLGQVGERVEYVGALLDLGADLDDQSQLERAIEHLVIVREQLSTAPHPVLGKLVDAVLLEAGRELALRIQESDIS